MSLDEFANFARNPTILYFSESLRFYMYKFDKVVAAWFECVAVSSNTVHTTMWFTGQPRPVLLSVLFRHVQIMGVLSGKVRCLLVGSSSGLSTWPRWHGKRWATSHKSLLRVWLEIQVLSAGYSWFLRILISAYSGSQLVGVLCTTLMAFIQPNFVFWRHLRHVQHHAVSYGRLEPTGKCKTHFKHKSEPSINLQSTYFRTWFSHCLSPICNSSKVRGIDILFNSGSRAV